MPKTIRMNQAQKNQVALEFFYETKAIYTLAELNKELPKKGISRSAVEKTIEEMEGDGLITAGKVGQSNYFWSFESSQAVASLTKIENLDCQISKIDNQIETIQQKIKNAQKLRSDNDREEKMQQLALYENEIEQCNSQLKQFEDCDPEKLEQLKQAIEVAKEASERWTDMIFDIAKTIKERKGMSNEDFFKAFQLPKDLDYIPSDDDQDTNMHK